MGSSRDSGKKLVNDLLISIVQKDGRTHELKNGREEIRWKIDSLEVELHPLSIITQS